MSCTQVIVGTRLSAGPKADRTERYPKGKTLYRVIWLGYAADAATWEPAEHISDDLLAEYEAGLEAEAELEAQEERDMQEEEDVESSVVPLDTA